MAKRSTRDKLKNEVNAGSMADIAFLLLIFFLVTTTIAQDSGILVKLPVYEEDIESVPLPPRNVFKILVNESDQILGRGQVIEISDIRPKIKEFIANPQGSPLFARSPSRAVVSLQTDRGTKYQAYISVYNELKGAYRELRDEYSMKKYGKKFDVKELTSEQYLAVKNALPIILSEAEPFEVKD